MPSGIWRRRSGSLRLHGSIHKLIVEAYAERSKGKLLQAILLEPTVNSYCGAAAVMEEMLELQKGSVPDLS